MALKLPKLQKPHILTDHELTQKHIQSLEAKIDKQMRMMKIMMKQIDKLMSVIEFAPGSSFVEIEHQKTLEEISIIKNSMTDKN